MAKVKRFKVLAVPIEVEYASPLLGRLFSLLAWLRLAKVKKFNLTLNNETVCSFYRLLVPRFLKGGVSGEE